LVKKKPMQLVDSSYGVPLARHRESPPLLIINGLIALEAANLA